MTQGHRYISSTGRRFARVAADATGGGTVTLTVPMDGRVPDEQMADARMEYVERIRERIARDEYRVDPAKVAEAMLRRLLDEPRLDRRRG